MAREIPGSRITGNIENRKKYVTLDQIQQVWNWLNDSPSFGVGGAVKVRKRVEAGFKAEDFCISGIHAEAILEKGYDLGWFRKTKERQTNGAMEQVIVAVPMKEMEKIPEPEPEKFIPIDQMLHLKPNEEKVITLTNTPILEHTSEPTKEPAKPEAILKACSFMNVNGLNYLAEPDVHEAVRILVEDLMAANPPAKHGEIEALIAKHDAEVESLERLIESHTATKNDLQATIGKLERKCQDLKDSLNKITESRDSWQKEAEKSKLKALSLEPFLTFHVKEYKVCSDGSPDPLVTIVGKVRMTQQFPEKLMKLADSVLRGTELNLSGAKKR